MGLEFFYYPVPFSPSEKSERFTEPAFLQIDNFAIGPVDDIVIELREVDARRPLGRMSHPGADHRERCAAVTGQSGP